MANQEHLDILKQGVEVWNQWRKEHREVHPDLSEADLAGAHFDDARFSFSRLTEARFSNAQLQRAYLVSSDLSYVDFRGANLSEAHLDGAKLHRANLSGARLHQAKIRSANLYGANLSRADLSFTNLDRTSFSNAILHETDFSFARIRFAEFFNVDFSAARGLDTIIHGGPSHLGVQTLSRSLNNLPAAFLQGAGVPDSLLTYARSLKQDAPVYATCLLSYASPDETFAKRLQADLEARGVLCWSVPYDIANEEVIALIYAKMVVYDMLLLVISEHSTTETTGRAVYYVVKEAVVKDRKGFVPFLLPIHLDKPPQRMPGTWARVLLLAQHQSRDFTHWNDNDAYQAAFEQVLRDLKAEA